MSELPRDILTALQHRAARVSIGPSSMRGAGSRGVVKAGRAFLCELQLSHFGTSRQSRFDRELDQATDGLLLAFPRSARYWGLARKGLNIFLRECLYTVYLRDAYKLGEAEMFFEVPLDSFTGRELHKVSGGRLPRWQTVRGLDRSVSNAFQQEAARVARERGFARVHLDAEWWGQRGATVTGRGLPKR